MARIVIEDLPVLEELTEQEMASIFGGASLGEEELPQTDTGGVIDGYS